MVDWNHLPPKEQKEFQYLVHCAQNSPTLTIGNILPLNMITCVSVKSCIKSYAEHQIIIFFTDFENNLFIFDASVQFHRLKLDFKWPSRDDTFSRSIY